MTTRTVRLTATPNRPSRIKSLLLDLVAGIDAATRISHGHTPTQDHPARIRERDRRELERRLAVRYGRT